MGRLWWPRGWYCFWYLDGCHGHDAHDRTDGRCSTSVRWVHRPFDHQHYHGCFIRYSIYECGKSYGSGIFWGFVYGVIWWFLGPLTLMPLFLGMGLGTSWTAAALSAQIPSLIGHIIFGVLLGWVYAALKLKKSKKLVG